MSIRNASPVSTPSAAASIIATLDAAAVAVSFSVPSTAAASRVAKIDTAADGVLTGEELRVDIDAAASGAKGLEVRLSFRTP